MTEIIAGWTGEAFTPLKRFAAQCAAEFVVGQRYILDVGSQQSVTKRAAFHATLADVYANLPDDVSFLSVDHFRYWLTIKCGFATERQYPCKTKAAATELALALRDDDPYAIVEVRDSVVTKWRAKSTKSQAMDGKEFSALADAVLAKAAEMLGVTPAELRALHASDRHKLEPELRGNDPPATKAPAGEMPAGQRKPLTLAEAVAMLPSGPIVRRAILKDGAPSIADFTRHEAMSELAIAEKIAMSNKVPGYPLGMQDRNGRVLYFEIRTKQRNHEIMSERIPEYPLRSCPACGRKTEDGFGLAGGGYGPYSYCDTHGIVAKSAELDGDLPAAPAATKEG